MIDGYGFRATHGRNADDRYSALPGGGAFLHRMHAVSVEWDESRTHEKVVRVMEARTARQRLESYGTGEAAHRPDARESCSGDGSVHGTPYKFSVFSDNPT